MRKSLLKSVLGVTLLEIMLVLAIAGVVIAMSIRYYQQAAQNQRITAGLGVIASISGAVESYRLSGKALTGVTMDGLKPFFPGSATPVSPWTNSSDGVTVTGTGTGVGDGQYLITIPTTDVNACKSFIASIDSTIYKTQECGSSADAKIIVTSG